MGRVFSVEEVMEGRYPEMGAHELAAEHIAERLFGPPMVSDDVDGEQDGCIVAGLVHGSTIHGNATVRSDLDLLLLYKAGDDSSQPKVLDVVSEVVDDVRQGLHVAVETKLIEVEDVYRATHSVDPIFLDYLLTAEADSPYSWEEPATTLLRCMPEAEFTPVAKLRALQRYTTQKKGKFATALVERSKEQVDLLRLQRALELPKNLGRKILSVTCGGFDVRTATKVDIARSLWEFIEAFPPYARIHDERILDAIYTLLEIDKEYTYLLADNINGSKDILEYETWLHENAGVTFDLAHLTCVGLHSCIDRYQASLGQEVEDSIT